MKLKKIKKFSQKTEVLSFSEEALVQDITVDMAKNHYGSAVITKNKKVIGIYTERDLLVKVIGSGKDPSQVQVGEVMTRKVQTATLEDTVLSCMQMMEKGGFRHMPIVNEKNELVSVISQKDLLSHAISIKKIVEIVYHNNPYLPAIACLLGGILLGTSGVFVRLSETGPVATAFFRFFFSLPIAWIWMIFDNVKATEPIMPVHWKEYALLFGAGLFVACDLFLYYNALKMTTVFNATLLNNLTAIFVPIFSWVFLKEKIHIYKIVAIGIILPGIWILVSTGGSTGVDNISGDLLAIASALSFSVSILISQKLRRTFSTPTILAWAGIFAMYTLGCLVYFDDGPILPQTGSGWVTLISLALCIQILSYALRTYSLPYLSATVATTTIMISPVTAAVMGWFFFGEYLTYIQMLGALIVISGIIYLKSKTMTSRDPTVY